MAGQAEDVLLRQDDDIGADADRLHRRLDGVAHVPRPDDRQPRDRPALAEGLGEALLAHQRAGGNEVDPPVREVGADHGQRLLEVGGRSLVGPDVDAPLPDRDRSLRFVPALPHIPLPCSSPTPFECSLGGAGRLPSIDSLSAIGQKPPIGTPPALLRLTFGGCQVASSYECREDDVRPSPLPRPNRPGRPAGRIRGSRVARRRDRRDAAAVLVRPRRPRRRLVAARVQPRAGDPAAVLLPVPARDEGGAAATGDRRAGRRPLAGGRRHPPRARPRRPRQPRAHRPPGLLRADRLGGGAGARLLRLAAGPGVLALGAAPRLHAAACPSSSTGRSTPRCSSSRRRSG